MALALSTLLPELGRSAGVLRRSGTTTATGTDKTAVDSGLITPAPSNNMLKDKFLLLTSGTYGTLALRRQLSSSTGADGTMTWLDALAGNSGSGVTYQLYDIDPQYLVDALNDARRLCQKHLVREIVDVGHVTGSIIFNGGFVHWTNSTTPLGWRKSTTTLARESAPLTGSAVSLTTAAGSIDTYIQPFLPIRMSLTDLENVGTLSMYADVKTSAASNARIRIYTGTPGETHNSDYHSGDGGWTQLKLENKSITKNINSALLTLVTGTTDAAEFTNVYTKGGPTVYQYAVPSTYIGKPQIAIATESELTRKGGAGLNYRPVSNYGFLRDVVGLDEAEAATVTGLVQFERPLPPLEHRMQWTGPCLLSEVTLLADTMEVDADTAPYLYAWARYSLFTRLAGERRHDTQLYDAYMRDAEKALAMVGEFERRGEHLSKSEARGEYPVRFR